MRLGLGLLAALLGLLAAGLAAAMLLPARLDPALVRAALERAATERLGAAVTIDGPVRFALLPRPILQADRVSLLHGAPGDPDALAVTAETLTARLSLSALSRARFAAAELVLDGAEMQVPFPLDVRVLTAARPATLRGTTIMLRHGRIRAGPLLAEQVDATLDADRITGNIALSGTFRRPDGSAWRAALRLSVPGVDGSAALDVGLSQIYAAEGLSATLTGQLAGDGGFSGRLAAAGPDLSRLIAAPPVAFGLGGRAGLAGGIASLDDATLTLDGSASRLDAVWHLMQPRLDVRLAASRLDLDAWARAMRAVPPALWTSLPVGLELSAEAASLAGGALRQVRAGLALDGTMVRVREARAIVPGNMDLAASGEADLAAATSRLTLRVDGSDAHATAAWLGHPDGPGGTVSGQASLYTHGSSIEAHDIAAKLDGVGVRGDIGWAITPDGRPDLIATLEVDRLDLGPWLARWQAGGALPAADVVLVLDTPHAVLPRLGPAALRADLKLRDGALEVRELRLSTPAWQALASGTRSAGGPLDAATVSVDAASGQSLLPIVPVWWRDRLAAWPALSGAPLHAVARMSGLLAAPHVSLAADLGSLHADVAADTAPSGRTTAKVALRAPDAAGLGAALGLPLRFLGDGSLAASADCVVAAGNVSGEGQLLAGALEAAGSWHLDFAGPVLALTGKLAATRLPLPEWEWRSTAPMPLWLLRGWHADFDLAADRAEGPGLALHEARARVTLDRASLTVADLSARLAGGGRISGRLALDAGSSPPAVTADLGVEAVRLPAKSWRPLDLLARDLSGQASLRAGGFAPAALLATLGGQARATATTASLVGIDIAGLGGDLTDAAVRAALSRGRTDLDAMTANVTFDRGLASLTAEGASGGARVTASGSIDLPAASVDLSLAVTPAISDPPRMGLRLSGPVDHATLTPELGALVRWRLARP